MNHVIYTDTLCVISISSSGLQSLLNICTDYCQLYVIRINAKTSVCMFFRSSVNKQYYAKHDLQDSITVLVSTGGMLQFKSPWLVAILSVVCVITLFSHLYYTLLPQQQLAFDRTNAIHVSTKYAY